MPADPYHHQPNRSGNEVPLRIAFLFLAGLLAACSSAAVAADLVNSGLMLRREDGMRIASQSVLLSQERVQLEMVATNVGKDAVTMTVTLPVPAMDFSRPEASTLREVKLSADGRAVNARRQLVVLLNGKDISWRIALNQWSEQEFLDFMRGAAAPAAKPALPAGWFDRAGKPRFSVHRDYVWDQRFKTGAPVSLSASYVPVLMQGKHRSTATLVASLGKDGCVDANINGRLQPLGARGGIGLSTLTFEPMGRMAWKRAIPDFTLRIRKQTDDDVVWSCMDGGKKTDARVFEYRRKDTVPQRRIDVRFAGDAAG